jgi:chitinase
MMSKDNENNNPTGLSALATTLRSHFSTATKPYYLSSAPQCPFPDASNPTALLLQCDFVWVQFYNNPSCEIGSSGFEDSVKQWSKALDQSTMATKPKLYLGLPAWSEAGSSAYGAIGGAKGMEGVVRGVEQMGLGNFGGAMFWE